MNTEGSWDKDSDKNLIKATFFTAELLHAYHYFRGISAITRHTHSVGFLGEVTFFITATFMLSHQYHIIANNLVDETGGQFDILLIDKVNGGNFWMELKSSFEKSTSGLSAAQRRVASEKRERFFLVNLSSLPLITEELVGNEKCTVTFI